VSLNEGEREREKNTFSHVISSLPFIQIGFLALLELPRQRQDDVNRRERESNDTIENNIGK
jgi:hypothetical protein